MAWTIYNNSALVQVMTWHRPTDKPLPKPMFISLIQICDLNNIFPIIS